MKRFQCWIILLLGLTIAGGVQAEKADATKPTNIEANQMASAMRQSLQIQTSFSNCLEGVGRV